MGLRINTNLAALGIHRDLAGHTLDLQRRFEHLSSGLRITRAGDDPSGLAMSERMRARIRSLGRAYANVEDGIGLVRTAEGATGKIAGLLIRMRELAVRAASGTMSRNDRDVLDQEYQQLRSEIDRVALGSEFNGKSLLDRNRRLDIQVGVHAGEDIAIRLSRLDQRGLRIRNTNVRTTAGTTRALQRVDRAIDILTAARGRLGATESRLESVLSSVVTQREHLSATESRIRDIDVASETAELARRAILQRAAVSLLAQANAQPALALRLLGFSAAPEGEDRRSVG